MASNRRTGGGNLCEVFSIVTNAFTASLIALSETIKTSIVRNDDGTYTITLTQERDDASFNTFLETYGPPPGTASASAETSTYEDSTTAGGGSSSNTPNVGIIVYGPGGSGTSDRKTLYAVAQVTSSSGGWDQENGKSTAPKIEFKTLQPAVATTIPTTIWADGSGDPVRKDLVATPVAVKTIPTSGVGSAGKVEFLAT